MFNSKSMKNMGIISELTSNLDEFPKEAISNRRIPLEDFPIFTKQDLQNVMINYLASCQAGAKIKLLTLLLWGRGKVLRIIIMEHIRRLMLLVLLGGLWTLLLKNPKLRLLLFLLELPQVSMFLLKLNFNLLIIVHPLNLSLSFQLHPIQILLVL